MHFSVTVHHRMGEMAATTVATSVSREATLALALESIQNPEVRSVQVRAIPAADKGEPRTIILWDPERADWPAALLTGLAEA